MTDLVRQQDDALAGLLAFKREREIVEATPKCATCGHAWVTPGERMALCNHPEQGMPRAVSIDYGCTAHTALKQHERTER